MLSCQTTPSSSASADWLPLSCHIPTHQQPTGKCEKSHTDMQSMEPGFALTKLVKFRLCAKLVISGSTALIWMILVSMISWESQLFAGTSFINIRAVDPEILPVFCDCHTLQNCKFKNLLKATSSWLSLFTESTPQGWVRWRCHSVKSSYKVTFCDKGQTGHVLSFSEEPRTKCCWVEYKESPQSLTAVSTTEHMSHPWKRCTPDLPSQKYRKTTESDVTPSCKSEGFQKQIYGNKLFSDSSNKLANFDFSPWNQYSVLFQHTRVCVRPPKVLWLHHQIKNSNQCSSCVFFLARKPKVWGTEPNV